MGEVLWHSLNERGETKFYDVLWESGEIETDIHINELKAVKSETHHHSKNEEDTPVNERKYSGEKMKITRRRLRKLIMETLGDDFSISDIIQTARRNPKKTYGHYNKNDGLLQVLKGKTATTVQDVNDQNIQRISRAHGISPGDLYDG